VAERKQSPNLWTATARPRATDADRFGESIVDRMHEAGGFVECKWPNFRGRPGEAEAD
jgi:hypothetical protein